MLEMSGRFIALPFATSVSLWGCLPMPEIPLTRVQYLFTDWRAMSGPNSTNFVLPLLHPLTDSEVSC